MWDLENVKPANIDEYLGIIELSMGCSDTNVVDIQKLGYKTQNEKLHM